MDSDRYYRIGEVAELLGLKTHVLRFWETEFPQLAPLRTESGQRLYTEGHVNTLRRIQQLLHVQGMTIEGAKRILEGTPDDGQGAADGMDAGLVRAIQAELEEICRLLRRGAEQ